MSPDATQKLVVVTGPSGSGRQTAVKGLEDIGFEVIDNLPLSLMPRLLEGGPLDHPLALGIDVRNRDFSVPGLMAVLDALDEIDSISAELLYLDCAAEVLVRRFSETRRPHPLDHDAAPRSGVEREIGLLAPVRLRAETLIDTTELTPHQLRDEIRRLFAPGESGALSVSVQSFSYKRGVPGGVDMVFDVRFLRNPHWQAELRSLTGCDTAVAAFVAEDPRFADFDRKLMDMISFLLPAYRDEGKAHLTIAFGCTGGRHRSVAVAEKVAMALADAGWRVSKRHRELERQSALGGGVAAEDGDKA